MISSHKEWGETGASSWTAHLGALPGTRFVKCGRKAQGSWTFIVWWVSYGPGLFPLPCPPASALAGELCCTVRRFQPPGPGFWWVPFHVLLKETTCPLSQFESFEAAVTVSHSALMSVDAVFLDTRFHPCIFPSHTNENTPCSWVFQSLPMPCTKVSIRK